MIKKYALLQIITAFVVLLSFKLALAAIPPTLNYQGHLTDSSGAPVDGAENMVFAIYDVETGGTALWSDSLSVTVNQGVFSVELGAVSPLPPGLFELSLWVGLTVDSDTEMVLKGDKSVPISLDVSAQIHTLSLKLGEHKIELTPGQKNTLWQGLSSLPSSKMAHEAAWEKHVELRGELEAPEE